MMPGTWRGREGWGVLTLLSRVSQTWIISLRCKFWLGTLGEVWGSFLTSYQMLLLWLPEVSGWKDSLSAGGGVGNETQCRAGYFGGRVERSWGVLSQVSSALSAVVFEFICWELWPRLGVVNTWKLGESGWLHAPSHIPCLYISSIW